MNGKHILGLLPIEWVILRTICEEAGVKQLVFRGEARRPGDRVDARTASSDMRNVRTRHATPVVPALALRIAESSGNIFGNGK